MPSVAIIGTRGYPSYYGGFETAVRHLAPHLANRGWNVTVYGRKNATVSNDPDRDDRIICTPTAGIETRSLSTLSHGLTASLDALKYKPDVALVMNCANGYWMPLLKARGIRIATNVDGLEWERAKWGPVARTAFRLGAKLTAQFSDTLIFDAEAIRAYWKRAFGRDGSFIPYGGRTPPSLRIEPGLRHRGYALAVARFVPENTIEEFIEAAERLASVGRTVVIVGSSGYGGPIEAQVGDLASRYHNVHWLGHLNDDQRLDSLWQHAGAYFHGHSVGGTNPALVQAMAAGAPVVARDTVYNREVLGDQGLFTPPDPSTIHTTLEGLLADPTAQENASRHGQLRAASSYTWDLVNEAYEEALSNLLPVRRTSTSARGVVGRAVSH